MTGWWPVCGGGGGLYRVVSDGVADMIDNAPTL